MNRLISAAFTQPPLSESQKDMAIADAMAKLQRDEKKE